MDYKRGRPAKRRQGGPSVDEVKDSIDKKESEKQQRKAEKRTIGIEQKNTPKLKSTNIKSIFNNNNFSLGKVGQGGTSKIVTLAKIVRKNKISINSLVKDKEGQDKKISTIKNIIKNQQSKIGKKIPGSDQDNLYKTLVETNKLLVDIQKQLVKSITKETKDSLDAERREGIEKSKKKLKTEENLLEKARKTISKGVKKVADKMLSPIKNIFDKIIQFLLTLGTGIAVNGVFEWLKDSKNVESVKGWFGWIKDNWKWMAAAVGAFTLLPVVSSILSVLGPLKILIALIAKGVPILVGILKAPAFLAALGIGGGIAGTLFGMKAVVDFFSKKASGGEAFFNGFEALKGQLKNAEITVIGSGKDEKFYVGKYRGQGGGAQNKTLEKSGSKEQKELVQEYIIRRDNLIELRNNRDKEIESRLDAYDPVPYEKGMGRDAARRAGPDPNTTARENIRIQTNKEFQDQIPGIIEMRKLGGPVKSGKPYIVGDQLGMKTAELFVPKQDGTIISNANTNKIIGNLKTQKIYNTISSKRKKGTNIKTMEFPTIINNDNNKIINNLKTQKIYNTISSKRKKGTNIKTMEFPPIFNNDTDIPEISVPSAPATRVPSISSFDASNPYIKTSLDIYGIIV